LVCFHLGQHFFPVVLYLGVIGSHFGQQACHYLFRVHSMAIHVPTVVSNPTIRSLQSHFWRQLSRI
jgi:hypothetical protein